jgi:signal transduction histidine kinase
VSGPRAVLREFVAGHRDEIIATCRARVGRRMAPRPTALELEHGIPLFLQELEHVLASELGDRAGAETAAIRHGGDLLRGGFTIAQVVHDYGDVCQTITELAIASSAPISTEEFRVLNDCLDSSIADAVTEYARLRELDVVAEDVRRANQHLGFIAHELRNMLASATLAFDVLRTGSVGIQGSTGAVLEQSLSGLRDLVDRSLTEVRLTAGLVRHDRVAVAQFVEDIEVSAMLGAKARKLRFSATEVDAALVMATDRQILWSIVSNLLQNAFKYTRPHTHVRLHVRITPDRIAFEIEDQCGGIPPGVSEHLFELHHQAGDDRSGLGLGLAICVRGATALGGAIQVRNQNDGCVFIVDLPRAPVDAAGPAAAASS